MRTDLRTRHLLVIGGTGTIGSAVVALARDAGATVTATASTASSVPDSGDDWRVRPTLVHGSGG